MKISRILIAAAALLLAAAVSCRKEDEPIPVLTLTSKMIGHEGGKQAVTVAAQKDWRLEVNYLSAEEGWLSFSQTSGKGIVGIFLTVSANNGDDSREAEIILSTPNHSIKTGIVQSGKTASAAPLWLELPALDNPNLHFFVHDWNGGQYVSNVSSPMRNYSFCWDKTNYVSHWVAYPLNKSLRSGNYGRYDQHTGGGFPKDPILEELGWDQPDIFSHSYGGGWTRGHQIPSADRQQEKANIATYFCTNMTPQQYDFNGGIWANLENRVRNFADRADTLYVCTGCDLSNALGWSGDYGGMRVRVPGAYYKALLRKKGNNYTAVAFYLPHTESIASGSFMDYILSVDELEEKTGVDFFANLYMVVGGKDKAAAIEAADPKSTVQSW